MANCVRIDRKSQTWIELLSVLVVTNSTPSDEKHKPERSWLGSSSRANSEPVTGLTRRTTPLPVSTARIFPSGEKANAPLSPMGGPSFHPSMAHKRQPPPLVASQRPSGLKQTEEPVSTGNSCASFPVWEFQILTFVPQWLPVATQRPSGLTLM